MTRSIQKSFHALGTVNTITVYRPSDETALNQAARRVLELDDRLSVFKASSEISQLNASAGHNFVPVSPDTLTLLKTAKRVSILSNGAFSVTSRPLTALWAIRTSHSTIPDGMEIEQARKLVGDRDLILDESGCRAMLNRREQAVDLGGIAKGFAADEARRILKEGEVIDAIINLGGTVIVMGTPKTVGIQHPGKSTGIPMGQLRIQNQAVVTSGSYERFSEAGGILHHHILDPETGASAASGLCSVTVIGTCAMELDALSTAMFVMGMEQGAQLAKQFGAETIFVTERMDVLCSPALRELFSLHPAYTNN
ncbi:MAG: putative thiamine biosynthesis lipoprotein [Oscillospiraceae bacterium]|nr:putative thiamine biosynthesis lipoprotein [Oscillospiraceae bacterium]